MVELRELVNDIGVIESKYGVLSNEFYQAFTNGELSEFDAYDEYRMEFIEWAALCKTRHKLRQSYR